MKTAGNAPPEETPKLWSAKARGIASALLLFHLAAVLAGAFGTPPMSVLERGVKEFFSTYHELIDQGYSYRYYAPEPPPTPILVAKLLDGEGKEIETVRVPERGLMPRLRYQRELAIATALAISVDQARENPNHEPSAPFWANAFARHIGRRNPACVRVKLYRELHLIPDLGETNRLLSRGERPPSLDAPEFYSIPELIGDYPCDPSAS